MCTSCKKSTSIHLPFDKIEEAPNQTIYNSHSMFTDSGVLQMDMNYAVLYNFSDEKRTQIFPKGVSSTFYNERGGKNVVLVSDSAINVQEEKLMKFYKHVKVCDYRNGDTLFTEALYWDQNAKLIYSDVKVRKISSGLILEGDGFDSDEQMNNVVLRNPRGVIR